jgi:taurine--2-oxoglutarate transaminase
MSDKTYSAQELVDLNRKYTLFSWAVQNAVNPIPAERAEGVYLWDVEGKRYIDFASQLMNVNIGHGDKRVIQAIKDQADQLLYVYPGMATKARGELGEMLAEITPKRLTKTFFTLGGAEAVENAMKIARLYTGKQKVLARYRSYHGATAGAATAGGDPRGTPAEPGVPWIVHVHDPYRYRCLFCRDLDACNLMCADHIEQTILFEGPETVAAILLEGYNGSSGIIAPPDPEYWQRIRAMCDKYDIMLISDEVMSGFGRTGEWFGIDLYGVEPDIIATAKGLTSGYLPLGATIVSDDIATYFDDKMLFAGLTYSAHPMSCAAGIANLKVIMEDNLLDNTKKMGKVLEKGLHDLQAEHPSVGDVRGVGLFYVIELVKNRDTREPMSGWNKPMSEAMQKVAATVRENGMSTFVKWDWIFCVPPLMINEEQINEGLEIINGALAVADEYTD